MTRMVVVVIVVVVFVVGVGRIVVVVIEMRARTIRLEVIASPIITMVVGRWPVVVMASIAT